MGCHALLQGIFPTQGSYPGLLHCRQILYQLSHQGSPHSVYKLPKSLACSELSLYGTESKTKAQMAKRHTKRCSALLIIREIQIKTTMRCHLTPVRMVIIKHATNKRWWALAHCWRGCKWVQPPWKTVWLLLLLLSRFSRVRLCATPEMAAHQDPPSLGFSRQEHWSGLPFPSLMHESEKWKWSCSVVSDS